MSGFESLLRAQGLARHFTRRAEIVRALDGVDLELVRGEHLLVSGPSGSGKSTLLQLLAGLDRPTAGDVWFEGRRLADLSERELVSWRARRVGFVLQDFGMIRSLSAFDNVRLQALLSRTEQGETRAHELLERMGLGHRLHHQPRELSRGEQQRVALARALVHRPALLLADEPTGSLDLESTRSFATLIEELKSERDLTVIIASHDSFWEKSSDRHLVLRGGRALAPLTPCGPKERP